MSKYWVNCIKCKYVKCFIRFDKQNGKEIINTIDGPNYYLENNNNKSIITRSNLYCMDYGCTDLELISFNGLLDWNITIGGECINYWDIECGINLNNS